MTRWRNASSIVVIISLLLSSIGLHAATQAAPASSLADAKHMPRAQDGDNGGSSVIVRQTSEVSSADVSPEAYVAGRYLVKFTSAVTDVLAQTDKLGAELGFEASHIYTGNFHGFAARLSNSALQALDARDDVLEIQADKIAGTLQAQTIPTGITRSGATLNKWADIDGVDERVDVDVAVVDSGVDFNHPDLNVYRNMNCTDATNALDDIGHGTHVSGTIGALDNGIGVVGVAPGARIWNVRIFKANTTFVSWLQCMFDYQLDHASEIDVSNHSWTGGDLATNGPCSETYLHQGFCDLVNANIVVVVAAGNASDDASFYSPASYSQVITVSALADTDGRIGGKGAATSDGDPDDSLAYFSNFGADIDFAAPGADIYSTCPTYTADYCATTNYASLSGTSMASPHVAGAAALYIARYGRTSTSGVKSGLRRTAEYVPIPGDTDGIVEPILYVGPINPQCTLSQSSGTPSTVVSVTCKYFRAEEAVDIRWGSATGSKLKGFFVSAAGSATTTFTIPNTPAGARNVFFVGRNSKAEESVPFTVTVKVSLTKTVGPGGTVVNVYLRGFQASETVTVRWDRGLPTEQVLRSNIVTSSSGSSSTFSITIPNSATVGAHKIDVRGNKGTATQRTFTVTSGGAAIGTPAQTPTATATPSATPVVSETPSVEPTPTEVPSEVPTEVPTNVPAEIPTEEPTQVPTEEPTAEPTVEPTIEPTQTPTPETTPEGGA